MMQEFKINLFPLCVCYKKVPNLNGLQLVKEIETNKSLLNSTVFPNDIFFRSAVHIFNISFLVGNVDAN